jgi:hypothetical protein
MKNGRNTWLFPSQWQVLVIFRTTSGLENRMGFHLRPVKIIDHLRTLCLMLGVVIVDA